TNLLRDADEPAGINELESTPIASARGLFDNNIGFEASDMTADEIDRLRPELYCHLAEDAEEPLFMKIHDAYTDVADNMPLIPAEATGGALYFIRNPLDVAVSFAHHNGWDYGTSISRMGDETFAFCRNPYRLHNQLRQKLLTWSGHVLSWMDHAPFPVCLLRYEDMKTQPLETFTRAVRFAGLPHVDGQIRKALEFSSFNVVRQQEEAEGFREKSPVAVHFFRKGKIGAWREELSEEQAQMIIRSHRDVMRRFGYLDEKGEIVF
ncbi:MAG: sulfotransferase domain-containing protein, partial [Syntrophales bacterium]|nr:sulfotransferase domain-containing protein [Syntrophales bacterium]